MKSDITCRYLSDDDNPPAARLTGVRLPRRSSTIVVPSSAIKETGDVIHEYFWILELRAVPGIWCHPGLP